VLLILSQARIDGTFSELEALPGAINDLTFGRRVIFGMNIPFLCVDSRGNEQRATQNNWRKRGKKKNREHAAAASFLLMCKGGHDCGNPHMTSIPC
jgi:hypothetical protein